MTEEASFARLAELVASAEACALVTVVKTTGSTPRAAGARMIVRHGGVSEGTIGGGRVEQEAIAIAGEVLASGAPRFVEMKLTQELGMCCGGTVGLFIEALSVAPIFVIYGAGHVGRATAAAATAAGFRVHVVDERADQLTAARFPGMTLHADLEAQEIPLVEGAFVLVTTHDHALDQRLVERVLKRPHRWLGLIGSRRKAEVTRQRLEAKAFSAEAIASLRCPVGVAIGAETPEEIAISIVGELVAVRRGARAVMETKAGPRAHEDGAG